MKIRFIVPLIVAVTAPSAARGQEMADAYLNEDAQELLRQGRLRRNEADRRINGYETTTRERFSVGVRGGIARRLAYRRETVARIDWDREGPIRFDVLAMREVAPLSRAGAAVPADMSAELLRLAFDPADSEMLLRVDSAMLRHPLAEGSEAHYQFEAGDTSMIRLADGQAVRLRELRVRPRRADPRLINGSLWLDAETHDLVRLRFKLASSYDPSRDDGEVTVATRADEDEDGRAETRSITLGDLPSFLGPARLSVDFVAIEYGLWERQWWLPRLVTARGGVRVNRIRIPISYERTYEGYTVRADAAPPPTLGADTTSRPCRERVRFAVSVDDPARDSTRQARTDAERARRERLAAGSGGRGDTASIPDCDREFIITAPADSALLNSAELPATAYAGELELVSDEELAAILGSVRQLPDPPPPRGAPRLEWGWQGPGLIRYNRVEGLSIGARLTHELSASTRALAEARLGTADRNPRAELAVERDGDVLRSRLSLYRRLQPERSSPSVHGTFASLGTLLLGRDDADYFDALGGELVAGPPDSRSQWYDLRLYAERQRGVSRNARFNLARVLVSDHNFRENFTADAAEQLGARLRLRGALGSNPASLRLAGELSLAAETGDYEMLRPEALLRVEAPLPLGLALSAEGAAGTVEGSKVASQALWRLGGASTLRGYPGSSLVGERYWRTRAELAWGIPGVRPLLFSDVAWAGSRNRFDSTGALPSVGAGVSLLDGVFRIDVARGLRSPGDWRLHAQFMTSF